MLGRGKVDHLVKDNFDFEDWTPMESSNRRSRDFDTDVAEDRTSYSTETDLQTRQREARKRTNDFNEKYFYPQDESSSSNSRNENDVNNDIVDRPERDCKFFVSQ